MGSSKRKIILAVTGASGAIYASQLMDEFQKRSDEISDVGVIMSDNAKYVWEHELGNRSFEEYGFDFYEKNDFTAPFASGSAQYDSMVIAPCSMGTIGRIASGISNDLTSRSADVILKERRKLILLARDTPLNLIQLQNMSTVTEAGGIICPAVPSFYSNPKSIEELVHTVTSRVIDLLGFQQDTYRWGK